MTLECSGPCWPPQPLPQINLSSLLVAQSRKTDQDAVSVLPGIVFISRNSLPLGICFRLCSQGARWRHGSTQADLERFSHQLRIKRIRSDLLTFTSQDKWKLKRITMKVLEDARFCVCACMHVRVHSLLNLSLSLWIQPGLANAPITFVSLRKYSLHQNLEIIAVVI